MVTKKRLRHPTRFATTTTLTPSTSCPLHSEIILDILSRLCIQDLSSCRLVCREWCDIIKDPFFVELHHSRLDQQNPSFLIIPQIQSLHSATLFMVDSKSMSTKLKATPLCVSLDDSSSRSPYIVGSSNGLLCLSNYEFYYILNPITDEMVRLPQAPTTDASRYMDCTSAQSGFAFDPTTKTYKIVRTWCFQYEDDEVERLAFEMHTIGSGEWRRVREIAHASHTYRAERTPVFVNNALHWQIKGPGDNHVIGAIDVGEETFRTMNNPPGFGYTRYESLSLHKGRLCFFKETGYTFDVWVMKDYGVESSWTKEYSMPMSPSITTYRHWIITEDGFRTATMGSTNEEHQLLVCSDFEKKVYRLIDIHQLSSANSPGFMAPVAYIGSYVSPKTIAAGTGVEVNVRLRD